MSKEKQIEGYLTTKAKPKNKIDCIAWLLLNVFGCKFCETCRDKPCNIKEGELCTNNIANYIREAVKEEAGYRKQIKGEWVDIGERYCKCSNCGTAFETLPTTFMFKENNIFCRHCGAKMKGGAE